MPFAPIFPTPFLTWLFFLGAIFALLAVSEWVAALAAATADTWGTEIGGRSGSRPRNIVTWRPVVRGDSGGVTPVGTIGTLAGAAFLAIVGLWLQPQLVSGVDWLVISIIGFLAATFDSIPGATVQARYFIPATGKITEARPPPKDLRQWYTVAGHGWTITW